MALALGLVLALAAGEAAVRALRVQGDQLYERDRQLGWVHRRGFQGLYVSPQARNEVRFSRDGLVGPDRDHAKPPGVSRVLLLGDSFTESIQVPYALTWGHRLEEALGPAWEVLNAGVAGYGTDNALLYFTEEGYRYDADIVFLLFFTGNDVTDNDHELYQRIGDGLPKPYFVLPGDDRQEPLVLRDFPLPPLDEGPLSRFKSALRHRSRLYLFVRDGTSRIRALRRHADSAQNGIPLHWNVYRIHPDPAFERGWQLTERLIERLRDEIVARNARFAVGSIPTAWRIDRNEAARLHERHPELRGPEWDFEAPDRRLHETSNRTAIPFCDLAPVLRRAAEHSEEPLFADHLSARGHEVVAAALDQFFRQELIGSR